MSKVEDEADRLKQGKLSPDPKDNVRPIGLAVPRVYTVLDLLRSSLDRVGESQRQALRCTTGHYMLDRITGGFRPGFTWLMGAGTSWGKSSWLVAVADENIRAGKRVLIVSSEDDESVYGDRLMMRRTGILATNHRDGKLELGDHSRMTAAVAAAAERNSPVYVDARRWKVEDLAGHLKKIIREQKIDLVAFDYVQEFCSKRRFQDERTKYKEIASVLRHVAKDEKIAGILFSQLTVDDKVKVPTRNNIRECRDMAHAAEVIVLGFIPDEDITGERNGHRLLIARKGSKCLFVDKVKNGPRSRIVELAWEEGTATFQTVTEHGIEKSYEERDQAAADARYRDRAGKATRQWCAGCGRVEVLLSEGAYCSRCERAPEPEPEPACIDEYDAYEPDPRGGY